MRGGEVVPGVLITFEEAVGLESAKYDTMQKRTKRNPEGYTTETRVREGSGKDQVMISVVSLSPKVRRTHKATQRAVRRDVIIEQKTEAAPQYVGTDPNEYTEDNKRKYYEMAEFVKRVQVFVDYDGADKIEFADRYAKGPDVNIPTPYRYAQNIFTASAWALKLEQEDGQSRGHFEPLALCRKPKEKATFPSLGDEQRAVVENIWLNREFAVNLGTWEILYERFLELTGAQGWESVPPIKTTSRYISCLIERPGAKGAQYLATSGLREWKDKKMLKSKRDTTSLKVIEYVVGGEYTFDFWVQWTVPNGRVKIVRPKLITWLDMRSRCIMGDVVCVNANSQTLEESLIKVIYSHPGGVSRTIHVDNGKDYTAKGMTGRNRRKCEIEFDLDSKTIGFYQSVGMQEVGCSLPYQPQDKPIERFFRTVCEEFSKWFASYTDMLTGSRIYAKRQRDVGGMPERRELLTMKEFFGAWTRWKNEKYYTRPHRGLKDVGEKWVAPTELLRNGERYEKAASPREYATMLLMRASTALVRNQGIQEFDALYTDYESARYINKCVGVKWDIDDVTELHIFDERGRKICEAAPAKLLTFDPHCSQAASEKHLRDQERQEREMREIINSMTWPYRERLEGGRASDITGKIDLAIRAKRSPRVVWLSVDREF